MLNINEKLQQVWESLSAEVVAVLEHDRAYTAGGHSMTDSWLALEAEAASHGYSASLRKPLEGDNLEVAYVDPQGESTAIYSVLHEEGVIETRFRGVQLTPEASNNMEVQKAAVREAVKLDRKVPKSGPEVMDALLRQHGAAMDGQSPLDGYSALDTWGSICEEADASGYASRIFFATDSTPDVVGQPGSVAYEINYFNRDGVMAKTRTVMDELGQIATVRDSGEIIPHLLLPVGNGLTVIGAQLAQDKWALAEDNQLRPKEQEPTIQQRGEALVQQTPQLKKPFHEVVAANLIEQLKQGTAPWIVPWNAGDGGGVMPFNPTTGKRYKGINAIHLMSQGRTDQRWLTYKQAAAIGAYVRKGEKSTDVQFWKFEEEQAKRDENNKLVRDGNGNIVKVRVRLERPKMFMAKVFNAEQIEGLPEYQRPTQGWSAIARAEAILAASGAIIVHGGDQAYYRPSTDKIHSPNREQFPSAEAYYATQLHELGHWTGHQTRLDRDLSHPFGSEGYAKEELRAEIASMILGAELGIGHDPGQHVAYIASWIKALQNDPLEIFRAASDAEKIQTFVLGLEQQQIQTQGQVQQSQQLQDEPTKKGVRMQIPAQSASPSVEAEDWALRAIKRGDLDQVVRRMSDDQLQVFRRVLNAMHPLANDNSFWMRRQEAMEAMFNDVDTVADQIQHAGDVVGDEIHRRSQVANRDQPTPSVAPATVLATSPAEAEVKAPYAGDADLAVVKAVRAVRQASDEESKATATAALHQASMNAFGFPVPADWTGKVRISGTDAQGRHVDYVGLVEGDQVSAVSVHVERDDDSHALLTTFPADNEGSALNKVIQLQERLEVIAAYSIKNQLWRDEAFAAIAMNRVARDPDATQEQMVKAQAEWQEVERRAVNNTPMHMTDEALAERFSEQERVQQEFIKSGDLDAAAVHRAEVLDDLQAEVKARGSAIVAPAGTRMVPVAVVDRLNDEEKVQQGYISSGNFEAAAVHRAEILDDLRADMEARHKVRLLQDEDLSPGEKMVATALFTFRNEPDADLKESFGRLLKATSGQVLGYELPADWSGETQVAGIATDPGGASVSMVQGDQKPEFYGLYARDQKGHAVWLADYASEAEALGEAATLAAINRQVAIKSAVSDQSTGYDPELVKDMMMYEAQIETLQSTIKASREAGDGNNVNFLTYGHPIEGSLMENRHFLSKCQKEAGLTDREVLRFDGAVRDGDVIEPDAGLWFDNWNETQQEGWPEDFVPLELTYKPRYGEQWTFNSQGQHVIFVRPLELEQQHEQGQSIGEPLKPADRTYIHVPFKEKEQARELGAKWDRQEKSWYIVAGADQKPFERWLAAPEVEPQVLADTHQAEPEGATEQPEQDAPQVSVVLKPGRQYLAVPYGEREAARAAGATWDKGAKSWYVGPNGDSKALARWNPDNVRNAQDPAQTLQDEFADAMRAIGLVPDRYKGVQHPVLDGKKHRVPVEGGRTGSRDGFYFGFTDGHPAGFIGNNKTGVTMKWMSKGYSISDEEKAVLAAEAAAKTQAREAALLETHLEVSARVTAGLADLVQVSELTPYLQAKNITPSLGILTDKSGVQTVIPAMDTAGKVWTAQYIQKDGTKRFAKEGRKEGCFHPLGGLKAIAAAPAIVIAEGYATAKTLSSALEFGTVAAFDSGNLLAVAKALHTMFPEKPVIIGGDDDAHLMLTHGVNVGRSKAQEAAKAVGGKAIFPLFTPEEVCYPAELPPVTPQAYRTHLAAAAAFKKMINEEGADSRETERAAELKSEMLSDAQLSALDVMKRRTDFNDLEAKCSSGQERLLRQVKNSVNQLIEQHQVKTVATQSVKVQLQGVDEQQVGRKAFSR